MPADGRAQALYLVTGTCRRTALAAPSIAGPASQQTKPTAARSPLSRCTLVFSLRQHEKSAPKSRRGMFRAPRSAARRRRDERQRHLPAGPRRCHRQTGGARGGVRGDHPGGGVPRRHCCRDLGPISPRRPSSPFVANLVEPRRRLNRERWLEARERARRNIPSLSAPEL